MSGHFSFEQSVGNGFACTGRVLENHLSECTFNAFQDPLLVRKGYRNLSVPNQLYEELEGFVSESKGRYVSVAEVVREAVREFLEKNHSHSKRN